MSIPAVSIITPTANREAFLPAIAQCVMRQTVDWEWLVHDDSAQPSAFMQALSARDPRVRYFHNEGERLSIGAKRNFLIDAARAEVIAHFDDDDHYASHYLARMMGLLAEHDAELVKLSEFYMYAPQTGFFGYMDLNAKTGTHYMLGGATVEQVEFHEKLQIGADFILFYGFSYVYRRRLMKLSSFDDLDLCDDESFIKKVVAAGCTTIAVDDRDGSCLHVIHPASTSRCFSRYMIPAFMMPRIFTQYEGFPDVA
ncbi:glycosyltransferase family 2 protein [Caballeronia telluris]|uniref:Glycosyl transferase group 2 family protein n=1 Tax=Caballeronia telluris TaxID=326475 RepID=A0A158GN77_9BURK|nr:glycosyltransferase [Caballeronia telluris]SAL33578.1 glycosyl transferase group 2 family protein [Caballeronia telluris]